MRRFLLSILLLGGLTTVSNAQSLPADVLRFSGNDLRTMAGYPQAKRDSILLSINNLDASSIALPNNGMTEDHQQQLKTVISDMLQVMRQVLKDPASADEMERKMASLNKRLTSLRDDIAYEENLRILKAGYEEDVRRRTQEYEAKNYNSDKEKRIAKRELEQELRDIRRDFEEERARLRKG
ncbi:hypothetical protein EGT74_01880 [Chitinophaga lutea]|uniref:Uncharacterized protein n=1 Tax=Chitinophaga lutea TaxID=2488634 RepID=A0A3N4PZJ1_9BACT|nr:hypothetical protein [Chitinophaga lutea]RPE12329.1 hypothetical protein EGT74_01880 [Chitinophaga lutea]